jgi:hypothetical protein
MDRASKGYMILAVLALLLAGFLTWNLAAPQSAEKFYNAIGIEKHEPSGEALGKATIQFKRTEE